MASPIAVSPSPVAVHPSASPLAGSASPNILQTAAQAISSPVHNPPGMQSPTPIAMAAVPSSPVHSVTSPPVQRIVTKVQAAKPLQQQQPQQPKQVLTPSSPILQQQPTQIIQTQVQAQPIVQQQQVTQITQQQPQTIRVVSGTGAISNAQQITTGAGTPIRVLSSTGQQVRIATQQPVVNVSTATVQQMAGQQTATVLRGQNIVTAGGQLQQQRIVSAPAGSTTTTATIGGKQIILQKPLTIVGGTAGGTATGTINNAVNQPQIVTLVKTSQGMTVQTLPKMNVLQKGTVAGTIQQPQQIVTSNIIGGGGTIQQATVGGQKTAVIGGNVVKLMSSTGTIGGKQILMKNPNIVQVGKVATNVAGKPTLVITNKAGQQIRTGNQQVIVVTTPQGIRTVSGTVTSSANNFVSLSTSQVKQVEDWAGSRSLFKNLGTLMQV